MHPPHSLLIGQHLNSSAPRVAEALRQRDASYLRDLARLQAQAGAAYLDVNTAALGDSVEAEALAWLVQVVQESCDLPLSLDSQNPDALRRALPLCCRPPLLNSFSGAVARPEELLSLIRDHCHLPIIAVCLDEAGTRTEAVTREEIARRLHERLTEQGVPESQMILDPVTLPSFCGEEAKEITLETIRRLRARFPAVRVLCAVSNYSFGSAAAGRLPAERRYAREARAAGADVFLCRVTDLRLRKILQHSIFA